MIYEVYGTYKTKETIDTDSQEFKRYKESWRAPKNATDEQVATCMAKYLFDCGGDYNLTSGYLDWVAKPTTIETWRQV